MRDALPAMVASYARKRSGNTACLASIRSSRGRARSFFAGTHRAGSAGPAPHRNYTRVLWTCQQATSTWQPRSTHNIVRAVPVPVSSQIRIYRIAIKGLPFEITFYFYLSICQVLVKDCRRNKPILFFFLWNYAYLANARLLEKFPCASSATRPVLAFRDERIRHDKHESFP